MTRYNRHEKRSILIILILVLCAVVFRLIAVQGVVTDAPQCYCWYAFYIPMLMIPMLGIFVAVCLGRPDDDSYVHVLFKKADDGSFKASSVSPNGQLMSD